MKKSVLIGVGVAVAAIGVLLMNRGGTGSMLGFLRTGDQDSDTGPHGSAGPTNRKTVSAAPTAKPSTTTSKPASTAARPITATKTGTAGIVQAPTVRATSTAPKGSTGPAGAVRVVTKAPATVAKSPATKATVPASPSAVSQFKTTADVRLSYSGGARAIIN